MESIGIPSTRTHACWTLRSSPTLWTLGILAAVGRVQHPKPLDRWYDAPVYQADVLEFLVHLGGLFKLLRVGRHFR